MGQELFKERFGAPQPPKGGAHFSHPAEGGTHSQALRAEGKSPSGDLGASLPEGWRVGKLGEEFDISIGRTPPRAESEWFSNKPIGKKWISIKDMVNS